MSEAAVRERAVRQRWAVPGSAHDKIVRWSKIILPSAVGALIAFAHWISLDARGRLPRNRRQRELIRARQQATAQSVGPDAFAGRTEKSV